MSSRLRLLPLVLAMAGSVLLSAGMVPAAAQTAPAPVTLKAGGDTYIVPLLGGVGPGLAQGSNPVDVSYLGQGLAKLDDFVQGDLDFAIADVPLTTEDAAALSKRTPYAYAPIAAGPLVFMYNLTRNSSNAQTAEAERIRDLQLSPTTLAAIFTGQVPGGQWRSDLITADYGKKVELSVAGGTIRPIVRSDPSGASLILTQWFNLKAKDLWNSFTTQAKVPSTPLREYPFVVGAVARQAGDDGAVGFVAKNREIGDESGGGMTSLTYTSPFKAKEVNLPTMAVKNAAGNYAKPTPQGVASALDAAQVNPDNTLTLNFDAPKADAYPLSFVTYAIVPTKGLSPEKSRALGTFLSTTAGPAGQAKAAELGFATLPKPLADRTLKIADQLSAQGPAAPAPDADPDASVSSSGAGGGGGASQAASSSGSGAADSGGEGLADTGSSPQGRLVGFGVALMVAGETLRRRMRRRV